MLVLIYCQLDNNNNKYREMLYEGSFVVYLLVLFLFIIYVGFNYYRIQSKRYHPDIVVLLLPFMVNFLMAKMVFVRINPLYSTLMPCILIYLLGRKMKKIRIFGLTGGIACGKSTLASMLQDKIGDQMAVIDCDKINGELRMKGQAGYKIILKMLQENGQNVQSYISSYSQEIIRQKLSEYSFQNKQFLKKLSKKVGLHIFLQIFKQIFTYSFSQKKLILIDAPTLFETKVLTHICYPIIVVGCSQQTQIKRIVNTRQMTEEQAKIRIGSQMPLAIKRKLADVYIENEKDQNEMLMKTLRALNVALEAGKKM